MNSLLNQVGQPSVLVMAGWCTLIVFLLAGCGVGSPPAAAPPTSVPPTATSVPPTQTLALSLTAASATPALPTSTTAPVGHVTTSPQATPEPTVTDAVAPTPLGPGQPSQIVEYGTSGRREIALTFDAGADRGYAEEILDLLQAEGIVASFGILGQWAEANPDLVQRMVAEGHMLFNHSWSHASFTGVTTGIAPLSTEERWVEVQRTEQVVRDLTGYELQPYFRPPYGDYDASTLTDLAAMGYGRTLIWSCDSRDSLGATADEILATCFDTAQPGRIVLLHVGAQSAAYEALPRMIASLRAQGFAFVTADQILGN